MPYVSTHPYEQAADGHYCGAPDPTTRIDVCTRNPEHPVHAVDRPEVEHLARLLAAQVSMIAAVAYPARENAGAFGPVSVVPELVEKPPRSTRCVSICRKGMPQPPMLTG